MMSLNEVVDLIFLIIGTIISCHFVLYVFSPMYYFSSAPGKLLSKSIVDVFTVVALKIVSLIFIFAIAVIFYPPLNSLVIFIENTFSLSLNFNFYQGTLFIIFTSMTISSALMLIEELKSISTKKLEIYKEEINMDIPQAKKLSLDRRLRGVRVLLANTDEMIAYTYGGFLIPPRIVISKFMLTPSWSGQLTAILLHELNHIERKDTFWALFLYSYDRLIRFVINLIQVPFKILQSTPILGFIAKIFLFIIQNVLEIWNIILGAGNLVSIKAEELADTESFEHIPSEYLIEALYDVNKGKLGHYKYRSDESIASDILNQTEDEYAAGYYKSSFSFKSIIKRLKQTHPPMWKRYFTLAQYSERQNLKKIKERKGIYQGILIIFLLVPFILIGINTYKENENYKFKNKEVLKYIKYLEGKKDE